MRHVLLVAAMLAGCSTALTTGGERVRVVTEAQRPACKFLKLVTVRKSLGPDKPGNALKDALNDVADAGGNGLFIITNSHHWADGASVSGEALQCPT